MYIRVHPERIFATIVAHFHIHIMNYGNTPVDELLQDLKDLPEAALTKEEIAKTRELLTKEIDKSDIVEIRRFHAATLNRLFSGDLD